MSEKQKICFVIQSFDDGKYDKRYREVYKGAIEAADLKAIRADEVLGTKPIIETIEENISLADTILADISESNENVFLELGYALAKNKPCVIIADKEIRRELPFDIRHRPVVFYDSHSPSSFLYLEKRITSNLVSELEREKQVRMSNVKTTGDLTVEDYENTVIGIILSQSTSDPNGIGAYVISREFNRFDYTDTTLSIAIESLKNRGLIVGMELFDENTTEKYLGYKLTDEGTRYVLNNREVFVAKKPKSLPVLFEEDDPF